MKRQLTALIMIIAVTAGLFACGNSTANSDAALDEGLTIICAGFSEYDWTMNILGDLADSHNVIYLGKSGADMHSFQPSTADIAAINSCDLIVYAGGASQDWIDEIASAGTGAYVIDMLQLGIDAKESYALIEEIKEGMQAEEEEPAALNGPDYDEHVWLSLRIAEDVCHEICTALSKLDPSNEAVYTDNETKYIAEISNLAEEYERALAEAPLNTVVFADRFPFRYLLSDYNIDYYAAFPGCAAESEASFETVVFLAGICDKLNLPAVIKIEGSMGNIATAVSGASERSIEILSMNSMQSVSQKDIENGAGYISIMRENLDVLEKALGK